MGNAVTRANQLVAYVPVASLQIAQDIDLRRRGWRKVGVATFGRITAVRRSIPYEECFAQSRAWRDNGHRATFDRLAGTERMQVVGLEQRDRIRDGGEIVDHPGIREIQVLAQG